MGTKYGQPGHNVRTQYGPALAGCGPGEGKRKPSASGSHRPSEENRADEAYLAKGIYRALCGEWVDGPEIRRAPEEVSCRACRRAEERELDAQEEADGWVTVRRTGRRRSRAKVAR